MQVPQWFSDQLKNIGGINKYGQPNLRVVWGPEQRREYGLCKGFYKYCDPNNPDKPMECWILETWIPPEFFGDPSEWNYDLLGPFPREGQYGLKSPLIIYNSAGEPYAVELDESCLTAIREKQFADIQWSKQNAARRLEMIEEQIAKSEAFRRERADKEADDLFDHYTSHQHELDQADKRVWSFPKHLEATARNSKMPVRRI